MTNIREDFMPADYVKTLNRIGNMVLRPTPALIAFLDLVKNTQG